MQPVPLNPNCAQVVLSVDGSLTMAGMTRTGVKTRLFCARATACRPPGSGTFCNHAPVCASITPREYRSVGGWHFRLRLHDAGCHRIHQLRVGFGRLAVDSVGLEVNFLT